MRAFVVVVALALICPLLAACSTGGSSLMPRGAESAGALRPDASKIKIDEPTEPVLLEVGQLTVAGISEAGYNGVFTTTSTGKTDCNKIASWSPRSGKGDPTFDLTVKARKLGSCTITISDSNQNTAQLELKVNFESLYSFGGGSDGATPMGVAALGDDLYGTTNAGGVAGDCPDEGNFTLYGLPGCGTVFELKPSAKSPTGYTGHILHRFTGSPDASTPRSGLTVLNGVLYGTSAQGGTVYPSGNCCGTFYSVTNAGAVNVLYSFGAVGNDGFVPFGGLTAVGGELYGTTRLGGGAGDHDNGTVFQMTTSGTEETLYSFGGGNDGYDPQESGVAVLDDWLYGTTSVGGNGYGVPSGNEGYGIVFTVNLHTDTGSVLYRFKGAPHDGANPFSGVAALGGVLYGTTTQPATVFSVSRSLGKERIVHVFRNEGVPMAGLTAFNGVLYGTTQPYGESKGTIFAINPSTGAEQTLHTFNATDGAYPRNLFLINGMLYGTTDRGGAHGFGTVFVLTP